MNRNSTSSQQSTHDHDANPVDGTWENDQIWEMLKQSPSVRASNGFADRVMENVRATGTKPTPFWRRNAYLVSSLAAAACIALAFVLMPEPPSSGVTITDVDAPESVIEREFADLDEAANQELLLAATDHLQDFSDTELVSLIGF